MGKKDKQTFGRALIKAANAKKRKLRAGNNSTLHVMEPKDGPDWAKKLQSVTTETPMQEMFSLAQLTGRKFTAEKIRGAYVPTKTFNTTIPQPSYREPLFIPRRPKWKFGVTQEEQDTKEKESFVEWRKFLIDLVQNKGACVTPYERNLELWKQLWRTLEKSDIVLILLDARNPLLFRCVDLEKYATEENCKIILLLNKADLTTEYSRKCWAEYFSKNNTRVIFFTAAKPKKERKISEESKEAEENDDSEKEESEGDDENPNEINVNDSELDQVERQLVDLAQEMNINVNRIDAIQETLDNVLENLKSGNPIEPLQQHVNEHFGRAKNTHELYDGEDVLKLLRKMKNDKLKDPTIVNVGMIGYPNVGKSSTVNILNKNKKVSVSTMPGHTRRLQTLILGNDIKLLDCPGLVMPTYAVTPDLLLTGVLPIDEMKSHDEPVARLCELVPRNVFVRKYGLLLPECNNSKSDYETILKAHAFNRGFMSASGQPDVSRSARIFLKEAASGQIKWEVLPPGCDPAPVDTSSVEEKKQSNRLPTPREIRAVGGWNQEDFYGNKWTGAHVKGKPVLGVTAPDRPIVGKPWKHEKKHANKNKKEKLRRLYAHLDQH